MDPVKQIKAVAQTYLQEQQLKEQAEYISVLEHTIEVIAEELGVPPQQLINEISVMGRAASAFKAAREGGSGVLGAGIQAVKAGVGAYKANASQASGRGNRSASPIQIPTAGNRMAGVAFQAGQQIGYGERQSGMGERDAARTLARRAMGNATPYEMSGHALSNAAAEVAQGERRRQSGIRASKRLQDITDKTGVGKAGFVKLGANEVVGRGLDRVRNFPAVGF